MAKNLYYMVIAKDYGCHLGRRLPFAARFSGYDYVIERATTLMAVTRNSRIYDRYGDPSRNTHISTSRDERGDDQKLSG